MNINEIDKKTAEALGVLYELKEANKKPRQTRFTKDQVRGNAMRVLNVIANLNQSERKRVLSHALKLNEI